MHHLTGKYQQKSQAYFEGARRDFVALLPDHPSASILEVGCSNGNTGALALSSGKCREYVGIELMPGPAEKARTRLTEVICGDIEEMQLTLENRHFDALILSEVLEHFVDPWQVLTSLGRYLRPGALVLSSSPNVAHWKIIRQLWNGRFDLEDKGIMDRTHLRWFTPATYAELFRDNGYAVDRVWPIADLPSGKRLLALMLGGREHLYYKQICLSAHYQP